MKGVVGVEDCGEEAEGESTDAERHVKAGVPETLKHPAPTLRLCSLSLGPRGSFQPGVLLAGAPPAVQRDDFLSADARFTHRTLLPAGPRLQPLDGAREGEMSTFSNTDQMNPVFCCLNTGVSAK